jgi:hypothetical protein
MNTDLPRKAKRAKKAPVATEKPLSFSYVPEPRVAEFMVETKKTSGASYKWQLDRAMLSVMGVAA